MIHPDEECKIMEEYDKWMDAYHAELERNSRRILKVIKTIKGDEFYKELEEFLKESCADALSITRTTENGKYQTEDYKLITGSWINQYVNGGYTGDTYEGFCFVEIKPGRYLKFHYEI